MTSLNNCNFIGRVTKPIEIRHLQNGDPVANVSIAVGEKYTDKNGEKKEITEFIDISCFAKGLCKVFESYVGKGDLIHVSGKWKTRKWQTDSGETRYKTELIINGFNGGLVMLGGSNKSDNAPQQQRHS